MDVRLDCRSVIRLLAERCGVKLGCTPVALDLESNAPSVMVQLRLVPLRVRALEEVTASRVEVRRVPSPITQTQIQRWRLSPAPMVVQRTLILAYDVFIYVRDL